MSPDLRPLFEARSVAIVGASERNHYARAVFDNMRRLGFAAERIHPVNPTRPEAFGRPCVPRVSELAEPVDLAVIVTPAATVNGVLDDCGLRGVRAAIVLSDGFAEQGEAGRALQEELAVTARTHGIALCGPNTMGVVAPDAGIGAWGGDLPVALRHGNVGAIFQSSGMLNLVLGLASARGVGFHAAVSVGNQAVLSAADYFEHLVRDPGIGVIVAFLEAVSDGSRFVDALADAARLGKPVITLRAGRSARARQNIVAHTGRLASSSKVWDAAFAQHGVIAVGNLDELIEHAVLFSRAGPTAPGGIGLVTISGGDCTLLADMAERVDAPLADPAPATAAQIGEVLHKHNVLANPLDVENTLRSDPPAFRRAVELLCADDALAIVAYRFNLPLRPTDELRAGYRFMAETARAHGRLPVFLSRASETLDPAWHALFEELDAPFLTEYERSLRALAALLRYRARPMNGAQGTPLDRPRQAKARTLLDSPMNYARTAALLDLYGIPRAADALVGDAAGAAAAAERIGFPVALKLVSPELPHKSEAGALRLGVTSAADAASVYHELVAKGGGVTIEGVLVQRMERGVAECIVGIQHDPELGSVVVAGLGGIFVEVFDDAALRLPPVDGESARAMLASLRGAPLLEGARGRPVADRDALADIIVRVSALASEVGDRIESLDLNPVIVRAAGNGAVAVDALIAMRSAISPGNSDR